MKKVFLILFALVSQAAFAQSINIPVDVARFYLSRHEYAKALEKQVTNRDSMNIELMAIINQQMAIIQTYKSDSSRLNEQVSLKDQECSALRTQTLELTNEVKRMKRQRNGIGVVGIILIILAVI